MTICRLRHLNMGFTDILTAAYGYGIIRRSGEGAPPLHRTNKQSDGDSRWQQ